MKPFICILTIIAFLLSIIVLGYRVEQSMFNEIAACFFISFCIYWYWSLGEWNQSTWKTLVFVGGLARFSLLFSFPSLSDDIYRYVWDGLLLNAGISPFQELPIYYLAAENNVPGLTPALFQALNSPEYYSVYPTFSQWIFSISAYIFPENIFGAAMVIRGFILLFEMLSLWLLYHLSLRVGYSETEAWRGTFLYACNPLVIIELTNNLHTEAFMIGFALLACYLLIDKKVFGASLAMGASLLGKFIPLIIYPVLLKRLGVWRMLIFGILSILIFAGGFMLVLPDWEHLRNIGSSINLYFQKFEFNASFYYIFRYFEWQKYGYNRVAQLGPALAIVTILMIGWLVLVGKTTTWKQTFGLMAGALVIHLLFSTTIHPWYILFPFSLSILAGQRYIAVWTSFIWLTYINYSYMPYHENLWIVWIEYLVFGSFMLYELFRMLVPKET